MTPGDQSLCHCQAPFLLVTYLVVETRQGSRLCPWRLSSCTAGATGLVLGVGCGTEQLSHIGVAWVTENKYTTENAGEVKDKVLPQKSLFNEVEVQEAKDFEYSASVISEHCIQTCFLLALYNMALKSPCKIPFYYVEMTFTRIVLNSAKCQGDTR